MPFIRLKSHGYDKLTGSIGNIEFENGVSVENVSRRDADRLGALMLVEDADTGTTCNAAKSVDDLLRPKDAVASKPKPEPEPEPDVEPDTETDVEPDTKEDAEQVETKIYTQAELEVIADQEGITGLRTIADTLGVKSNSVVSLMDKILKAQAK